MQYAVIRVGGKQYKVAKGDTILVDLLPLEKDGIFSIDEVMLLGGNGNSKVGRPFVEGAKVKAKVLEHRKGKKIRVAKYKAKVRYRRISGFRSLQTVVRIEDIQS